MADPTPSPRKDRILTADAKEILDAAKPSILGASPRRGNYVQKATGYSVATDISRASQTQLEPGAKPESTRREQGCPCQSVTEQESTFMKSVAYGVDRAASCQEPPVESLFKKSNFSTAVDSAMDTSSAENASMLAIAISTVMLMASEYPKIPDEYLEYTKNYLECIKDGSEQGPPNIQGILKHIKYLRESGLVRPMGEESKPNITTTGAEGIAEGTTERTERSPRYRRYQGRLRRSQEPELYKPK